MQKDRHAGLIHFTRRTRLGLHAEFKTGPMVILKTFALGFDATRILGGRSGVRTKARMNLFELRQIAERLPAPRSRQPQRFILADLPRFTKSVSKCLSRLAGNFARERKSILAAFRRHPQQSKSLIERIRSDSGFLKGDPPLGERRGFNPAAAMS